ncbi:MAG TPA: hypothetical protein ENJ60_06225 [Aeromonadales bacterium]|nr:hypothetical protein [Aeromonadales bacterium]
MQPKILIIIDNNQTAVVSETLDAALALAAFDENVHLWFKDAGLRQLLSNTQNNARIIEALTFYGIEQVFIAKTETNLKLHNQRNFRIATQWIEPSDMATFLNNYSNVLRFN